VRQRSHVDDPGRRGLQHRGQQQQREQKMAQMIGGQLELDPVLGQRFRTHHYTCVGENVTD